MQSETGPELSEWELNSWALLTVPDLGTPMRNQNLSSSQTQTFSQPTNFYDTSLISNNFNHSDINDILNAPSNTASRHSPQQQFTSTSSATSSAQPSQSRQSKPSPSHKSPASSSSPSSPNSKVHKRTLNTLAARRYRQKRVDQMADLEQKLKESEKEKEELQMRVARLEGEVEVLRGLLRPSPK
jgi:hypothetical protein